MLVLDSCMTEIGPVRIGEHLSLDQLVLVARLLFHHHALAERLEPDRLHNKLL